MYKPDTTFDAPNGSIEDWINISTSKFATESSFNGPSDEAGDSSIFNSNRSNLSKKSLINRLDYIAKGRYSSLRAISNELETS